MNDILGKTKFSTIFFGSLIDGHFENVLTRSREVIRHTCVRQWKASRPESNNFALAVQLLPKFTSGKKKICSILI